MNAIKKLVFGIFSILTLALLSSCAQYDARYTPPSTESGMQCVQSCLTEKRICNNNCHNRKMITDIASTVQKSLEASKHNKYSGSTTTSSSTDDCGCQYMYNDCYKSCGGDIKYVCIANCGK